jgi:hypothetical protein
MRRASVRLAVVAVASLAPDRRVDRVGACRHENRSGTQIQGTPERMSQSCLYKYHESAETLAIAMKSAAASWLIRRLNIHSMDQFHWRVETCG